MLNVVYSHRHKTFHIPLKQTKPNCKTIETSMQEAPSDYDSIKALVENQQHNQI